MLSNEEIKEMIKKDSKSPEELKAICKNCPWDRLCILPPRMTSAEVQEKIQNPPRPTNPNGKKEDNIMSTMLSFMLFGREDIQVRNCEYFALRIRQDKTLVEKIKKLMQE